VGRRLPWKRLTPFLLLAAIIAAVWVGILMVPRGESAAPTFAGTTLSENTAPGFRLLDQFGQATSLSQLRGRPVIMTFMQAHCRELCPVTAEKIRRAVEGLGQSGKRVAVVAISADPEGDTPAAVRGFSRTHKLLHRWHYVIGSRQELRTVWHGYHVYVAPASAPPALRELHTSATFVIDREGRERVLYGNDLTVGGLERDLRILLGLPVQGSAEAADPAPRVGHSAPDFVLKPVNGSRLALSALHGQVVLLNFWATWCIPCRTEMPELQRWYLQHRSQRFVVVGFDKQEGRGDVAPFLQKLHVTYPVVLDESGSVSAQYEVIGLPTTLVVDREGIVRAVRLGALDKNYLQTTVAPIVAAGG